MNTARFLSAAALVSLAGHAMAQPVIDGVRDNAFYGTTPIWSQNQPTSFGDNAGGTCDNTTVGSPAAVSTGVEMVIPLASIGNPSPANIKICVFVNGGGHDFMSNQFLGGVPSGTPTEVTANLGEPRNADLSTVGNNQFFSGVVSTALGVPTIDGKVTVGGFPNDAILYGALKATQTCRTGFGDATTGTGGACNGSELDGVYAVVSGANLYILITGNLESNNNKLEIFLDTNPAVGQNQLVETNPATPSGIHRMSASSDGTNNAPIGPGLKFDTGFTADYWIGMGGYVDGVTNAYVGYVDFAQLYGIANPTDPGIGYYCGGFTAQSNGVLTGGDVGAPAILATIDNTNIVGVPGACPPPSGNVNTANGSEIDAIYGKIDNGKLYLMLTGNCASDYTKLSIFIDALKGGQNKIRGNNADTDFGAMQRMGDDGTGNGLKFDAGFAPDYWLSYSNGNVGAGSPPAVQQYVNALTLRTDGMIIDPNTGFPLDYGSYDGGDKATHQPVTFSGPLLDPQPGTTQSVRANYAPRTASDNLQTNPTTPAIPASGILKVAYDNSNTLGVTAASGTGGDAVTTGLEMEITLPELACVGNGCGPAPTSVKVAGFLTHGASTGGGGYGYVGNQVIGGLPTSADLGEVRAIDLSLIAGNQFIVISSGSCYANCDGSTASPLLTANDFQCFLNQYAQQAPYANCDGSTANPLLTANDFQCFLIKYAQGCP